MRRRDCGPGDGTPRRRDAGIVRHRDCGRGTVHRDGEHGEVRRAGKLGSVRFVIFLIFGRGWAFLQGAQVVEGAGVDAIELDLDAAEIVSAGKVLDEGLNVGRGASSRTGDWPKRRDTGTVGR